MAPLLFASVGLLFIGVTTTALIYWFGARKIFGRREYPIAFGWTIAFALFICSFLGSAPFLIEQAVWLLLIPFAGLATRLFSIQRLVLISSNSNENRQAG